MPDREVAARLANLRRASVDLERRLRADDLGAADAESYWRGQLDAFRREIVDALEHFPFHQRAVQQIGRAASSAEEMAWGDAALAELAEIRTRLDPIIQRLG